MNNIVDFICYLSFIIFIVIFYIINIEMSKISDSFEKDIENINDDNLYKKLINYNKKLIKYHSVIYLVFLCLGFCIAIGIFNDVFMKQGVKEYFRGNMEVKYQEVYEDSILIKCDTIIKLK